MRTLWINVVGMVALSGIANAQMTPSQALDEGKEFGRGTNGFTQGSTAISAGDATDSVPNYSNDPQETAIYNDGKSAITGAGTTKIAECKTAVADSAYNQQECDVVNYLTEYEKAGEFDIDTDTDPVLVNSTTIIGNATIETTGQVSACHVETVTTPATYTDATCYQTPGTEVVSCDKVLTVECSDAEGTDSGGVKEETITSEGAFSYSYNGNGAYGFNMGWGYGGTGAGFHVVRLSFELADVNQLAFFLLQYFEADDHAMLRVNGHDVYYAGRWTYVSGRLGQYKMLTCSSGDPDGRNKDPQPRSNNVNSASAVNNDTDDCYPKTFINSSGYWETDGHTSVNPNLDLKPYLKTGKNQINLYFWDGGSYGGGRAIMYSHLFSQQVCTDSWTDNCAPYAARVP